MTRHDGRRRRRGARGARWGRVGCAWCREGRLHCRPVDVVHGTPSGSPCKCAGRALRPGRKGPRSRRLIERVFDAILGRWDSATHRCRGPSWSAGSPPGARARRWPPAWANGGDSPAWSSQAPPTSRPPVLHRADRRRCGALRRAALPHQLQLPRRARRTPRSWPRRRLASGSRRWPSPITTASTGWCASPRPPGRWAPHRVRGGAHARWPAPRPRRASPDPPGEHLVVLAARPRGLRPAGAAITTAQLAGEKGAPRIGVEVLAALARGAVGGAHRVPQGPRRPCVGARRAGRSGRALDAW
jgi:hypothetical protein